VQARQLLHRDIKPHNLLLARQAAPPRTSAGAAASWRLLLADFGLARGLEEVRSTSG